MRPPPPPTPPPILPPPPPPTPPPTPPPPPPRCRRPSSPTASMAHRRDRRLSRWTRRSKTTRWKPFRVRAAWEPRDRQGPQAKTAVTVRRRTTRKCARASATSFQVETASLGSMARTAQTRPRTILGSPSFASSVHQVNEEVAARHRLNCRSSRAARRRGQKRRRWTVSEHLRLYFRVYTVFRLGPRGENGAPGQVGHRGPQGGERKAAAGSKKATCKFQLLFSVMGVPGVDGMPGASGAKGADGVLHDEPKEGEAGPPGPVS